tara:strand:+ start:186 stop:644 length:459 start_codon:yes stop_codon:yes gene_type:complete
MKRLVADGADVNCRGRHGHSPLIEAASSGHCEAVRFLLGAGADPAALTDDRAPTLFYACVRGHEEVVDLLLDAGANPNANRDSGFSLREGDSPGVSMLHVAIWHRFTRVVEALLRAGANIDFLVRGRDALAVAMETEDQEIIDLVKRRAGRR